VLSSNTHVREKTLRDLQIASLQSGVLGFIPSYAHAPGNFLVKLFNYLFAIVAGGLINFSTMIRKQNETLAVKKVNNYVTVDDQPRYA